MTDAPKQGICDYSQVFIVTTYTSGNELRGPAVRFGKFESERDARQALADAGFTNGKFGWRKSYTDAVIECSTEYKNHRVDLHHQIAVAAYQAGLEAAASNVLGATVIVAPKSVGQREGAESIRQQAVLVIRALRADPETLDAIVAKVTGGT